MRRVVLAVALLFAACGDNNEPQSLTPDGPPPADAPPDTPTVNPLTPCLDRPDEQLAPPNGQLPCDLLPPGFTAQ